MNTIKKILLAYDGFERDEHIPAQALHLADETGAEILVLNVISPPNTSFRETNKVTMKFMNNLIEETRSKIMIEKLDSHLKNNVKINWKIRHGIPHIEIIREVIQSDFDILMLMDHPINRDHASSFGGVTMKLFRECPCPVWALRTQANENFQNIFAAVDIGNEDPDGNRPSDQIMKYSTDLTRLHKSKLYIFHAWRLWGEELLSHQGRMTDEEIEELLEETKSQHQESLNELIKKHNTLELDPKVILEKGNPDTLIPKHVEDMKIDLLVMGTLSRTGLPGVLIGNSAEKILARVPNTSVLTVKPKGFKSPIEL